MMKHSLEDLIDMHLFQEMQDKLNEIYSFPSAIIDLDGKILTATAWQDICTKFHRVHPESEQECIRSDQYISSHLHEANPAVSYRCPHGMIDNAVPIFINGEHLANFFTGQLFLEEPDLDFFSKQARKFSFDEEKYLNAVKKVPVWSRDKLDRYLSFIKVFTEILAGIGHRQLAEKDARKQLAEQEEMFRQMAENIEDVFLLSNDDGILYISPMFEKIWGISCENLYRNPKLLTESVHPEDQARIMQALESEEYTVHGYFHDEYRIIRPDKSIAWVRTRSFPVYGPDGKTIRKAGIINDITAKKQLETSLRESENKYSAAFFTIPDAVSITRLDGDFVDVNEGFTELTGYSREEILSGKIKGKDLWAHMPEREEIIKSLRANEEVRNREVMVRRKDNSLVPCQLSARIFLLNNQDHVLIIRHDIRQQKKAEDAMNDLNNKLAAQNEEYEALNEELNDNVNRLRLINDELEISKAKAEESDRLKTSFLQNMSHEIRTPLNGLLGFAELLDSQSVPEAKKSQYLRFIQNSARRLLDVVSNILDISMIETGQLTLENEPISIEKLMEELKQNYQFKIDPGKIQFSVILPESTYNHRLISDHARLVQILSNLLNNAIKYTQEGIIEIGCRFTSEGILFYVRDSGIGIDPAYHATIFERFRQGDPEISMQKGGTGLGLAISKSLAEKMGGRLWIESKPGVGSTFFLSLPLEAKQAKTNQEHSADNETMDKDHDVTVLIAEDEDINYDVMQEMISGSVSHIIRAQDGAEAVQQCITNPSISLVIMDMKMPVMNGFEATRQIRQLRPELPVIAVTAYAMEQDRVKALEAGCTDYLSKPVTLKALNGMVMQYTRQFADK